MQNLNLITELTNIILIQGLGYFVRQHWLKWSSQAGSYTSAVAVISLLLMLL